ncbi:MAG: DoxX family membrane protein [Acidobacteria bacterium]|nr:DoxX family membrane protein [Acidobacteriota bacterium]
MRRGSGGESDVALRVLSIVLGLFLLLMGLSKRAWLMDSGILIAQLYEWLDTAGPASRWYLDTIAIPGAPVFARLVLLGELATGAALLCGVQVRAAAIVAMFMVLNFHFAADILFHYAYLINGYGPPVLGGLLALAIGGPRLPFAVGRGS